MRCRILFGVLLAGVLLTACGQKKQISGEAFIPRDTFVEVLVDLHLVDGITNDRKFYRRYEGVDSIDLLAPILRKHDVTREMFDTTVYEYSRHPELFDQVYGDVLMRLNIMLDENDQQDEVSTGGE